MSLTQLTINFNIQIQSAFMTIGYDISYVVALVKTARVVYIFRKVSPTKRASRHILYSILYYNIIDVQYRR